MSQYSFDEDRGDVVVAWTTGTGRRSLSAFAWPGEWEAGLELAEALDALAARMWERYEAGGVKVTGEREYDGLAGPWVRDAVTREATRADGGTRSYDPLVGAAEHLGRVIYSGDPEICDEVLQLVLAEVDLEVAAVERAARGDFSERAAQASSLSRAVVIPAHVTQADEIIALNPLLYNRRLAEVDPTSACVAAAWWLWAACVVTSRVSHVEVNEVVTESDNIYAVPYVTPQRLLTQFVADGAVERHVVAMIAKAKEIASGVYPDLGELSTTVQRLVEGAESGGEALGSLGLVLTSLDLGRPAPDMLEDIMTGIEAAWTLYAEMTFREPSTVDEEDEEFDEQLSIQAQLAHQVLFIELVRAERARLVTRHA